MKHFFALCALLALPLGSLLAQTPIDDGTHRNFKVEQNREAYYPGGNEALYKHFHEQLKYPEAARAAKVQGDVYLSFFVEADSTVSNVVAMNDLGHGLNEEAIRVIKTVKFVPALQNGRPVRQNMMLPVMFRIYE